MKKLLNYLVMPWHFLATTADSSYFTVLEDLDAKAAKKLFALLTFAQTERQLRKSKKDVVTASLKDIKLAINSKESYISIIKELKKLENHKFLCNIKHIKGSFGGKIEFELTNEYFEYFEGNKSKSLSYRDYILNIDKFTGMKTVESLYVAMVSEYRNKTTIYVSFLINLFGLNKSTKLEWKRSKDKLIRAFKAAKVSFSYKCYAFKLTKKASFLKKEGERRMKQQQVNMEELDERFEGMTHEEIQEELKFEEEMRRRRKENQAKGFGYQSDPKEIAKIAKLRKEGRLDEYTNKN